MAIDIKIKKEFGRFCLDVSMQSKGKRIGILGASGCGKSLTLKSIAGIERPDEGYVNINGRILLDTNQKIDLKPQQRRVGYLFQNYALFPTMTVEENIAAGLTKMDFKKYFISLLIGKISLVYFWGFVGTSFIESISNPKILIKIFILLLITYINLSDFKD